MRLSSTSSLPAGRRFALASLLAGLVLVVPAVAGAQADSVGQPSDLCSDPSCDTEATPVAKPSSERDWQQIGGDIFPGATAGKYDAKSSPTRVSDDLFSVSFFRQLHGVAGGAGCIDPPTGLTGEDLSGALRDCTRGPAIYTYSQPAEGVEGTWTRAIVEGADKRGFVGAVAWISPNKALAVGGTREYPRRELGALPGEPGGPGQPPLPDPAGTARAWLFDPATYDNQVWHELDVPNDMGALTALDFSKSPDTQCGQAWRECGFAGGMRQIWPWKNGRFDPEVVYRGACPGDTSSCPTLPSKSEDARAPVIDGSDWLFRVRAIRFDPDPTYPRPATAVTSGCCNADPQKNTARWLVYYKQQPTAPASWNVSLAHQGGAVEGGETLPDGYYAIGPGPSIIASPSGPRRAIEPASRIFGPANRTLGQGGPAGAAGGYGQPQLGQPQLNTVKSPVAGDAGGTTSDLLIEAVDPRLSNVRLVAGDGDEDGPPTAITGQGLLPGWQYPDGVMDWAVGELMSTGQGVAYTTTAHRRELSEPRLLKCSPLIVPPKCDLPSADYIAQQQRSQSLFALSTYALSGYTYLPATHVGWGVGDRGALVRLAPAGSFSRDVEAAPPALGARSSANLPDSSPYDGFRAPESKHGPGLLPVLTAQAPQKVSQSQLVPAGSPNAAFGNGQTVGTIVMSRDGGEGWALGPQVDVSGSTTALFHYALGKWSNCDPLGLRAQGDTLVSPDPACADLAQLSSGSNDLSARITGAARIPYENDPNPTNDDDFSAVAAGSQVKIAASKAQGGSISAPLLLRYQNQAWRVDLQGMRDLAASPNATRGPATGIAFTRPDDGWMVVSGGVVDGNTFIFHYNGKRWTDCRSPEGSSPDGADSCHGNGLLDLPDAARMPIRMTSAGSRVYLYGARDGASGQAVLDQEAQLATQALYPLVLYKDPGGLWRSDQGGYDPKNAPGGARQDQQGAIYSLSVTKASAATYAGWALGIFGANANASAASLAAAHYTSATGRLPNPSNDPFLRLDGDQWRPFSAGAVGDEYPPTSFGQVLALPGRDLAAGPAFMTPTTDPYGPNNPMISFDPARSGWRVFPTPFSMVPRGYDPRQQGSVSALTSDNQGGVWLAASSVNDDTTWFYHYTDRPPEPVFAEVSHPIRERATVATGAADGSFWVGTDSNSLYRHDRLTGWGRVRIPGWDRGRVVINASPVYGLAFDSVGRGVAVGKGGRIADLTPTTARLDDAAGRVCAAVGSPGPCGTGHDLRTAAIGPDDSVLVGGDRRALLYRPPGGLFHSVSKPEVSISATITAISYPSEGHAWLATDSGEVFGGTLDGADWRWQRETLDASGVPLTTNKNGGQTALRAIAILPGGRGYAVGDRGLVLERTGEGPAPWQRLASDSGANLDSIAIGPGGYGLVVGGDDGLILTLERGRFEVARPGDAYDPAWASGRQGGSAQTVGIALLAGSRSGELEAWATSQGFATPTAILHYAADSGDRLLNPAARAQPLLDSGPSRQGELSFTAFGRSDCQLSTRAGAGTGDMACPEPTGSKLVNDAISQRVTKEITDSASHPDGPAFSLFSGDVDDIAGSSEGKTASAPTEMSVVHHRFAELVVDPLRQAGVPLFAALGGQDLSHAGVCPVLLQLYVCDSTHHSRIGPSLAWQQAFGSQPAPFGDGDPASRHGVSFEPVGSVAKDGNAQTHYAFDVIRDGKA
ncbi:MAG: hypothetical protein QOJ38_1044, partial [Solirubrobacterales bacterium]|nr:hypothetical protein [Solirubrobacterales bacterium]